MAGSCAERGLAHFVVRSGIGDIAAGSGDGSADASSCGGAEILFAAERKCGGGLASAAVRATGTELCGRTVAVLALRSMRGPVISVGRISLGAAHRLRNLVFLSARAGVHRAGGEVHTQLNS